MSRYSFFISNSRYVKGTLPKNAVPTIGIEFAGKSISLSNGKTVKA